MGRGGSGPVNQKACEPVEHQGPVNKKACESVDHQQGPVNHCDFTVDQQLSEPVDPAGGRHPDCLLPGQRRDRRAGPPRTASRGASHHIRTVVIRHRSAL